MRVNYFLNYVNSSGSQIDFNYYTLYLDHKEATNLRLRMEKKQALPLEKDSPNSMGIEAILSSEPCWIAVGTAADLIKLPDMTVLHAGSPLINPHEPPLAILNSTILACIYEGWAKNEADAEKLIKSGIIVLKPSHDFRVSIPLAAVVSKSTPLTVIQVDKNSKQLWYGFLGSGLGPQMRFGTRDLAVIERLSYRDSILMPGFQELLKSGPVDLLSIARAALNEGDDLHNRLSSATLILHSIFLSRKLESKNISDTLNTLLETPTYFLSQWIPACAAMLDKANGIQGSSIITNITGNGSESAIQISGIPNRWITSKAFTIEGPAIKTGPAIVDFPPHIGDSGIIDAYGLGGQALHRSPSLKAALSPWLKSDNDQRSQSILMSQNIIIDTAVGIDIKKIVGTRNVPLVSTGMVAPNGAGLLGRGIGVMPIEIFEQANQELINLTKS